jgi:hypothetical protein
MRVSKKIKSNSVECVLRYVDNLIDFMDERMVNSLVTVDESFIRLKSELHYYRICNTKR